jgi:hypothetical protein
LSSRMVALVSSCSGQQPMSAIVSFELRVPGNKRMQTFDRIISDRGSKYAVSGEPCRSPDEARIFIKNLVTRWYGGKHLGGDRFRHVQTAVRYYLDNRSA